MVLLVYVIYLLCTITHGHPGSGKDPSSWPLQLPEQDLAEKTGQPERIPIKLEHLSQGTPTPFIQEDEPAQQKKRREKRDLDQRMQKLASKFRSDKVKQCCHDGRKHYESELNCEKTPNQLENKWGKRCHDAFKSCCFHVVEYYVKPMHESFLTQMERHELFEVEHVARIIRIKDVHFTSANKHSIKLEEIVSPRSLLIRDEKSDVLTSLDTEIADVARKYDNDTAECCHRGKLNYSYNSECRRNVEEPQCSAAFQDCCSRAQEFFQKPRRVGLNIHLKSSTGMLELKIVENSEEMVASEPTKFQMHKESESVPGGRTWRPQKTLLEISIAVAIMNKTLAMKQCCYDGYIHYLTNSECMRRPEEYEEKNEEKREWPCHATFQTCCFRVQDYLQKPNEFLNMNLTIFKGKFVTVMTSEFEVHEGVTLEEEQGRMATWRHREASLKEDIHIFSGNYKSDMEKCCCHDGYRHYIMNVECLRRLEEKETEGIRECYNAFRDCCFRAQNDLWYSP